MSKILCAISGIEFSVQHMPLTLTSREHSHPIFSVPAPRLLKLTERWLEQELTDTEDYLLYLALFNSTGLMEFRSPASICADTPSIIAHHMHHLTDIVEIILNHGEERSQQLFHLPTFVITPDTKCLEDSGEWIKIWRQCYADYANKYRTSTALEKLSRKETILERLIKDKTKDISQYAHQLANWAAQAGKFPEFAAGLDTSILGGRQMTLSQYWQHIIKCCAKTEAIWEIPDEDLNELIEHCEENIEHGSIYSHTLMALLRAGAERKKNFLDLGDIDLGAGGITFRILDADTSIEDANKLALIDSAPIAQPIESQYPNKLAYIKAKMNWKLKQDYERGQAVAAKIAEINAAESVLHPNKKIVINKGDL
jgi:hypothetical protein